MSDEVNSSAGVPVDVAAGHRLGTAGILLKAAREREGIHIAALAVSMKVSVKKLEALEADRLDLLHDAVFVRALASSVCRALKIDSTPVLQLLPSGAPPRLDVENRGINAPFNSPNQVSKSPLAGGLLRAPAVAVMILMLAAIVVYFYPEASNEFSRDEKSSLAGHAITSEASSEPVEAPLPSPRGPALPESSGADSVLSVAIPNAVAALPSTTVTQLAPMTSAPKTLSDAPRQDVSSPDSNAGAILVFRAGGLAWVQVTDAKGVQLVSRTLQPAEVVGVTGNLPFSVVVGRADLMTVELRGKPFDLNTIAQNNVARFEVKP